jgi:hypothetical protein
MSKVIAALNKHLLTGTILALTSLLGLLHLAPLSLEIQLKDIIYCIKCIWGDCKPSLLLCRVSRYNQQYRIHLCWD